MEKGIVPRSGIDTDARWGFSHTKGWIFGYKLHMISSTGSHALYLYQLMLQLPMYTIIKSIDALTSSLPSDNNKENTLHDCRPWI